MSAALGTLTLRSNDTEPHTFTGWLRLGPLSIPVTGRLLPETIELDGLLVRGELRRDGRRRVGTLHHCSDRYSLDGEWDEDAEGKVLRCIVGEPP